MPLPHDGAVYHNVENGTLIGCALANANIVPSKTLFFVFYESDEKMFNLYVFCLLQISTSGC